MAGMDEPAGPEGEFPEKPRDRFREMGPCLKGIVIMGRVPKVFGGRGRFPSGREGNCVLMEREL